MRDHRDIINAYGGYVPVARDCGVPTGTASSWKTRKSIPREYWSALVVGARQAGIDGIDLETLAKTTPKRQARHCDTKYRDGGNQAAAPAQDADQ
jgi:hypothetical protein